MPEIKRSYDNNGEEVIEVDMHPKDILHNPILNKGTGFTEEERIDLGIHGLLPYHTSTIEEQVERRYANFRSKESEIDKYSFLMALQDRNETLFFNLVSKHAEEMLPYIYTPTVGDASLNFSYLYNQNRGIYLSYPFKDRMDEMVARIPKERVDVIVVTDGGRILGLGDLGVGGMAIPVGKLSLYTLFGGIHPDYTLPVLLDVGTDNPGLLSDPLYLGWRHERLKGAEYQEFIDLFVKAITKRFPNVLIQWEDFSKQNAQPLLERYKHHYCCFNDDIQGTAGVVTAGILAAIKGTDSDLKHHRLVIYGGGSAGIGVAHLITRAMVKDGMSEEDAKSRIFVLGRNGLAHTKSEGLDDLKKRYAQEAIVIEKWGVKNMQNISLHETIEHAKPTILIGTSAQPGSFTEELVVEMKKHVARPIIFPLSNPTSKSEALPEDLMKWTRGQALIATGSPFPPVEFEGKKYTIGQCNNVFIFPGVGLGVIATGAKRVTDNMFLRAAEVLSRFAPILNNPFGSLFPRIKQLPVISKTIATEVGKVAIEEGVCDHPPEDVEKAVEKAYWQPKYPKIKRKK
ncbi:NAD-dependent malic enzyme [Simkania negevensis]|uniref:Malolactic enzyme n=1 Tax=Simkania negevensis (strain ATCC VR-1471 / DSM 27360 / Z) TaxID=331113 RepID=F8L8H5_SIMNZ|nr:NAD-dependent malic enzyme [Simkania negevensis]CCB89101.1 NAD-dependent malic enzyme [Simkania negevensis Z]